MVGAYEFMAATAAYSNPCEQNITISVTNSLKNNGCRNPEISI